MFSQVQIDEIKTFLQPGIPVVLVAHKSPDGDALGSTLGLKLFLEKKYNVKASVLLPDSFPADLSWLPDSSSIVIFEKNKEVGLRLLTNATLVFCLDFNHPSRVFEMEAPLREALGLKIMLDHHQQPDPFVKWMWSDVTASSTCEIVYQFIAKLGGENDVDKSIALCLYTGIMTDTGSFRYSVTSAETHRVVAKLLDTGIEQWKIHEAIFNTNTLSKLKLWGYALSEKLVVIPEYRTAFISLDTDELERFNYQDGDLEGLVSYPLSITNTVMGVLMTRRKGKIRISFRSVGSFSANMFARNHFSGGGHENAAGGTFPGTLAETVEHFLAVLPLYKDQLSPDA